MVIGIQLEPDRAVVLNEIWNDDQGSDPNDGHDGQHLGEGVAALAVSRVHVGVSFEQPVCHRRSPWLKYYSVMIWTFL